MQVSQAIDRIIPLVTVVRQRQAEHYRRLANDVGLICFADLAANPVPPIPEKKPLRALLDALAAPAFVALLYVFYVGRGDFDPRVCVANGGTPSMPAVTCSGRSTLPSTRPRGGRGCARRAWTSTAWPMPACAWVADVPDLLRVGLTPLRARRKLRDANLLPTTSSPSPLSGAA
jgi:hypothetical protein